VLGVMGCLGGISVMTVTDEVQCVRKSKVEGELILLDILLAIRWLLLEQQWLDHVLVLVLRR
jgi:hypothetical protein